MTNIGDRLEKLFTQLNIKKIVVVDDQLEKPLDAALVTRIVSQIPEAAEAAAEYFPDIDLNADNQNMFDQISAILGTLESDQLSLLRSSLTPFDDEASDVEVAKAVREMAPKNFPVLFLTPAEWVKKRESLLAEATVAARTLFFFDQNISEDGAHGFTKGTEIIAALAGEDASAFGTRWFCGLLTHTFDKGAEVSAWRRLSEEEELSLELFMPISKKNLGDSDAFYGAVYRTLINIYTEKMKSVGESAFQKALGDALTEFKNLDPIDFEHMIVNSSGVEGVSEFETLLRLYSIVQKDRVKKELLGGERLGQFLDAAQIVKGVADVARALPEASSTRLAQLRFGELYETGDLVNTFRDPLRNGDFFEIGAPRSLKLWVLIAQPCDLMVRLDGKRSREENFKVAVLAPIKTGDPGLPPEIKHGLTFSLDHFDHKGTQRAIVSFADATPVNLNVLDLAVLRDDGRCEFSPTAAIEGRFPSVAWDARAKRLQENYKGFAKKNEVPSVCPAAAFQKRGKYENSKFSYQVRRCGRVRDPLANSLLAAFSRYLSREAYDHDFSNDKKS